MAQIRAATVTDAPVILSFIRELAEYEREPDAVELTEDVLRSQMAAAQPPFECLLVEEDGQARGIALFFENYSTWKGRPGLYLEDLYVTPDGRGRGYGKALLVRLAQIAVERGCARVEWSVLNWNTPSIAFYRSLGAKPLEAWTTFRLTGSALTELADPSS